jgi:hypothetical protein
MSLDRTKALLDGAPELGNPKALLAELLAAAVELVSLEENDFAWTSWKDKAAALRDLETHMATLRSSGHVDIDRLSLLFAPTGPMQELSLSSGWGEPFVKLASYFDIAKAELKSDA